ncbi:hypothetical protein ACFQI7_12995 [Paenibacillus allorhizosphaerae]|uniref:HNH endonuclease n=1 Tax=Paenibacillus allorhizosphaerae TaxID=2849866 RepID=A0ABM8VL61_9BACL|nr:hypothetical protein [Paenibacillus allorhizosphaerae]CAG7648159.1 hypothetical protein PAECIP111802_04140 [Paenibacillus allorhizosphaerae]
MEKYSRSTISQAKRKRLLREVPNTLRWYQQEEVFNHFKNDCALTGKYQNLCKDHFIPISWGRTVRKYGIGGNTYANIIPLDRSINSSKGSMNPFIWFERYGERHGISIEKWNYAVQYIAEKHRMTTFYYINRVNACYIEILAKNWVEKINSRIEPDGNVHPVYINNALKMNLNIPVVIEQFGSVKTKEIFQLSETIDLIKQSKSWFVSRLNQK